MIEDREGNIWFPGANRLWKYDGSAFTNIDICEDKAGNIWTSSQESSAWLLLRYDGKALSDEKPTVAENKFTCSYWSIFQADDGSSWYGALWVYTVMIEIQLLTLKVKELNTSKMCNVFVRAPRLLHYTFGVFYFSGRITKVKRQSTEHSFRAIIPPLCEIVRLTPSVMC